MKIVRLDIPYNQEMEKGCEIFFDVVCEIGKFLVQCYACDVRFPPL